MSRAVAQLIDTGLSVFVAGKTKPLSFNFRGAELWRNAQSCLGSPVIRRIPVMDDEVFLTCPKSGYSALAVLSPLDEGPVRYRCVSAVEYRNRKASIHQDQSGDDAENMLELWSYDPRPLAVDDVVDPFSLYLSFMGETDERVRKAADDLLEEHSPW